ncbi:MAG: hypothetical protein J6X75_02930, partial [Clostridia bacterium]|nr:hypothetical protein [Clostridia bacterium]
SLLKEAGLSFIPGVEFSCKDENGKYHILGYGYDPESDAIKEVIDTGHTYRISKLKKRIDFLKKEYGFSFSDEDLSALYKLDNPGKPHIGNLMVKYGYAPSKEIAIQTYVDKFHAGSEYVRPEQAIKGILAAGGVPVLAHPSYGRGDELILSSEMELRLRRLISFGLEGVEAFYSGFTPKLEEEILSFAEKFGLYVTAGSDYHGKNKLVQLGDTNLSSDAPYPTGLKRFLERVLG